MNSMRNTTRMESKLSCFDRCGLSQPVGPVPKPASLLLRAIAFRGRGGPARRLGRSTASCGPTLARTQGTAARRVSGLVAVHGVSSWRTGLLARQPGGALCGLANNSRNPHGFAALGKVLMGIWVFFPLAVQAVPAGIDHDPWDSLLQEYVDDRGLVDYAGWSESGESLEKLDSYLAQYAPTEADQAEGDERVASLVNAYNAFTIRMILENFPTRSIRLLDDPFGGERNKVDGEMISLDEIEHERLRPLIGWKVHSMVVCAARSCPPLLNRAYRAESWESQMQERYRTWLARDDLNEYLPKKNRVEISKIFDWYSEDFEGGHSIPSVLSRFGPPEQRDFLTSGDFRIRYMDYHWGLNAQSDLGSDYKHSFFRSLF